MLYTRHQQAESFAGVASAALHNVDDLTLYITAMRSENAVGSSIHLGADRPRGDALVALGDDLVVNELDRPT